MKMRRWIATLTIIVVALNLLDILTTKAALGVGCEESNGFAIALFTTFGFTLGLLVKFAAVTMAGCLTIYSYQFDCRELRIILPTCLVYTVCLYIVVVSNNIINILR
jgi:hypothetical protein